MKIFVSAIGISLCAMGCTKTSKHDVAVFEIAPGSISQPAPVSAKYAVKIAPPGDDDFEKIPETQIRVERGTVMGFQTTPTGIVAFAGTERISIDAPDGSTLKWQAKTKKHTQLATNLRRARQYMLWGAGAVGAAMVDSAIDKAFDDVAGSSDAKKQKQPKKAWKPRASDADFHLISDLYWATLKEAAEKK